MNTGSKTAIITGGARGIGNIIAMHLLKQSYNVVISCRNQGELDKAIDGMKDISANCLGVTADITNPEHVNI